MVRSCSCFQMLLLSVRAFLPVVAMVTGVNRVVPVTSDPRANGGPLVTDCGTAHKLLPLHVSRWVKLKPPIGFNVSNEGFCHFRSI